MTEMTQTSTPLDYMRASPLDQRQRRLEILTRHADDAQSEHGEWQPSDELSSASPTRQAAWKRILCTIASTERIEGTLLVPIRDAFRDDPAALSFLDSQTRDENRHAQLLLRYVKNTFNHERKTRSLASRVIYDRLLPMVAESFRENPIVGLALLLTYERFSLKFYPQLRAAAEKDGAENLLQLVRRIEKDELRHLSGVEALIGREIQRNGPASAATLVAARAALAIFRVDSSMSPLALHNREVRGHLLDLGFDLRALNREARECVETTLNFISSQALELAILGS